MHTAGALGLADAVFAMRAVEINVTSIGIDVAAEVHAGLESAQPENAAGDEVGLPVGLGKLGKMPPGGQARFEHHAGRLAAADALGDLVQAARGAE